MFVCVVLDVFAQNKIELRKLDIHKSKKNVVHIKLKNFKEINLTGLKTHK